MESLYYAIEQRQDGWHAHPMEVNAVDDDHVFISHDDAVAWCRDQGVIPREDDRDYGHDLDVGDPFV